MVTLSALNLLNMPQYIKNVYLLKINKNYEWGYKYAYTKGKKL